MNVAYFVQPPLIVPSCAVVPRDNRSRMKHVVYTANHGGRECAARVALPRLFVDFAVHYLLLLKRFETFVSFVPVCAFPQSNRHIPFIVSLLEDRGASVYITLTPSSLSLNTSAGVVLQELAAFMISIHS